MQHNIKERITNRACGSDFTLNIDTALNVVTNNHKDEVYASIDSLDSGIEYHFEYVDCVPRVRRSPQERGRRAMLRERARRNNEQNLQRRNERRERRMRRGRPNRGNRVRTCRGRGCGRIEMRRNHPSRSFRHQR